MTASVTYTEERRATIQKLEAVIVSGADGAATGASTRRYTGEVLRLVVMPGAAENQPSDDFDIVVTDMDGIDVLYGHGADLDNAAPSSVVAQMGCILNDFLTVTAANMGDSKRATVILYIKQ